MRITVWLFIQCTVTVCGRQVFLGSHKAPDNDDDSAGEQGRQPAGLVQYVHRSSGTSKPIATSTAKPAREVEKWVVDHIYYDQYQSDSTGTGDVVPDFCPSIPDIASDEACALNQCKSDSDCTGDQRCCFNGCIFTCLIEIKPPPVLDWRVEPRRSRSGTSWLIEGASSSSPDVEPCNTAPVGNDEDPLLCPHGYFCYVEESDSNKRKNGKKETRGVCVKELDNGSIEKEGIILTSPLEGRKYCTVDNVVLLDGARIRLIDRQCRCKRGNLSCASYETDSKDKVTKVKKSKRQHDKKDRKDKMDKNNRKERSKKNRDKRRKRKKRKLSKAKNRTT